VSSYVQNNEIEASQIPTLIKTTYKTLSKLDKYQTNHSSPTRKPAIPISKSIENDYIICLEDGKKLKLLKRYLRTKYKPSPEEYRAKWDLPPDYPMVAPRYAAKKSEFAKQFGLGKHKNK
jgi:predicted transcriptional regulator